MKEIAERLGKAVEEVEKDFEEFVKKQYPESWEDAKGKLSKIDSDDLDFFREAFRVNRVRRRGGFGKGDEYVGMIVGHVSLRDLMSKQRDLAIEQAEIDLNNVLRHGIRPYNNDNTVSIGRAHYAEGSWKVSNANDQVIHTEQGEESDIPVWAIAVPNKSYYIALLGANGPKRASSLKREWLFIGNTAEKFLTEGPLPPMRLECSFDAADVHLQMNKPISFKAEAGESYFNPDEAILKANNIDPSYGLGWVPDKQKSTAESMFAPDQYLSQFMGFVPDLSRVMDYYEDNKEYSEKTGRTYGPLFCLRGVVDYIDHEGEANRYSDGGYRHSLTLSSAALRRDGENNLWVNVSRYLVNDHHAFQGLKFDSWCDYTAGTQVFLTVRSSTWESDMGETRLNLDALNVWPVPKRILWGQDAADDDLSGLDGFRSD